MTAYDEQDLAGLIGALPPAPASWVQAAQVLPRTRRELRELLPRIEQDAGFRAEATRDLERAIEQAGFEARPQLLDELRKGLASDDRAG